MDLYSIIAIIIGVTVHEFSHAWMATVLGDPTPGYQGRLSLNPLKHIDPLGFLMMLFVRFGWGKPVIFSPQYLSNPQVGSALIALAGPVSNGVVALIFGASLGFIINNSAPGTPLNSDTIFMLSHNFIFIGEQGVSSTLLPLTKLFYWITTVNIFLMIFNLLPLPPLDGSKILALFLPGDGMMRLAKWRQKGYIFLFILIAGDQLLSRQLGISFLSQYIFIPFLDLSWKIILAFA